MYYGRGAGRLPTAGAVVADVCASLSGAAKREFVPVFERKDGVAKAFDEIEFTYYIRANCPKVELTDKLEAVCDKVEIISESADTIEAVAGKMSYKTLSEILPEATAIRILD